MPSRNESRGENRQRLMEIMEVVRRHDITRGMSPEKLCAIIEELGPTFIKLGQILSMRSDFLPKEYCEALKKLRSDVSPHVLCPGGRHRGGLLRPSPRRGLFLL